MSETPISLPLGSIDFQALHNALTAKRPNDSDITKALEPVWPPKAEGEQAEAATAPVAPAPPEPPAIINASE